MLLIITRLGNMSRARVGWLQANLRHTGRMLSRQLGSTILFWAEKYTKNVEYFYGML